MKAYIKIDCEPLPMFTERKRKLPEQQIGSLSKMPSENAINCDVEIYENNRADNFEKTDDTRNERKRVSDVYWQILPYRHPPPPLHNAFCSER